MIIKKNYPFLSTTPSTNIIFHPLFHYPIYPPPHIIPTRHYSFLSLGFAFTSLALAPVECLPPYLIPPPSNSYCSFSCPLPIPSYQLHPTLLPPYIKHHGYRPIRPAYISPHPIIKPHRYKQPVILPFILLLNFFSIFLYQDFSLALSSVSYAH